MTLQASGAISLEDIQTEFGGANPISIEEYYRGGVNVPIIPETVGIPASGTISMSDFYGTSATAAFTVSISTQTIFSLNSQASLQTVSTGQMQSIANLSTSNIAGEWGTPITVGIGSSYECRVSSVSGGTLTGSAINTWLAMSSTRTWNNTTPNATISFTFEIRLNGGAVQDTATITLDYATSGR